MSGLVALLAIFAPGLLLMAAALPVWGRLRADRRAAAVLRGVNAGVVGILGAALWKPVAVSAVRSVWDLLVAGAAFAALTAWKVAPWIVVLTVGGVYLLVALLR